MVQLHPLRRAGLTLAVLSCLALGARAQFVIDNGKIPATGSYTENVDFGDVDLDGDWDAVLADGGDNGNDQNRIWINQGGAQAGTLGEFLDETASLFPSFADDSRDIEFVDFDDDGDLDLYTSNTAQISNQGNRWWTNMGGKQAGTTGFYTDETASRWVGLGGAGSSIDPGQLIAGSFIDWSCDCDFADLDNDGDMDLVHSTYGGTFNGLVPTRLFLNDGDGKFSEFNPSGFQLSGPALSEGDPGLWCDGMQSSNTTNSTGAFCDIATTALDIDVGDIDGDFDLDILHGARNEPPRMFANRLDGSSLAEDNGGLLGFRDVTGAVYPGGYTQGTFGHYEQEMGDMDGDGDLDIYGLNWLFNGFSFDDITLTNDGDGTFSNVTVLSGSTADDNEGDFLDYDNDGDLDLYVANFSGQDKLYRNDGGPTSYTLVSLPSFSAVSLDADCADVDGDGDTDVLVAEDQGDNETFLRNDTSANDLTAPSIPNVESIGPVRLSRTAPYVVRAHVYDNAPYYITYYNDTELLVSVDGTPLPSIPAKSSGGQVFRAEIPGNLVGKVGYAFRSTDEHGNAGTSATHFYRTYYERFHGFQAAAPAEASAGAGEIFARGFGTGMPGAGGTPALSALSVPFAGSTLWLHGTNASPEASFVLLVGDRGLEEPLAIGDLARLHVGGELLHVVRGHADANGELVVPVEIAADLPAGTRLFLQLATLDGTLLRWATSGGLEITTR